MPRCSPASKGGCSPCSLARASCAWLRSRRQEAALLTRPARRGVLKGSGRRASQEDSTTPPASRTKGGLLGGRDCRRLAKQRVDEWCVTYEAFESRFRHCLHG